jgi:hypothetical protein
VVTTAKGRAGLERVRVSRAEEAMHASAGFATHHAASGQARVRNEAATKPERVVDDNLLQSCSRCMSVTSAVSRRCSDAARSSRAAQLQRIRLPRPAVLM